MSGTAVSHRDGAALVALAVTAAEAAAAIIREATPRRRALTWQHKSEFDFVSEVDLAAESRALAILTAALPEARILAEETAATLTPAERDAGVTIILDPLDGTTNFLHGVPEYAVSLGIMVEGQLAAGVVLNVPRGECFTAWANGGAWLGEERLSVSDITEPSKALIGTGFPFKDPTEIPAYQAQCARVMAATSGIRRPGAASIDLASVAAGRFDAFWENVLAPWDVAAGILLIREAGGIVTDFDGNPSHPTHGPIVAGNPQMHAWLQATLP
jgi:myo-inositol-1(or 4)-monophosphatase